MRTPQLITPRLVLKPFSLDMVGDHQVGWLNNPEVVKYSEQRHRKHSRQSCTAFANSIDHENDHMWAIYAKSHHIGNISARRDVPNQVAEISILIGERSVWGSGYGAEAWRECCDWLLSDGVRKIIAGTMALNYAMIGVFNKTGMNIECVRKGEFLLDGEPIDLVMASRWRNP